MRLKRNGQWAWATGSSPSEPELRPKSSLTVGLLAALPAIDSDVDLPRNSQREVRAKPCCGRSLVWGWFGAVPKTCHTMSANHIHAMSW
jgi:hypothetical protein